LSSFAPSLTTPASATVAAVLGLSEGGANGEGPLLPACAPPRSQGFGGAGRPAFNSSTPTSDMHFRKLPKVPVLIQLQYSVYQSKLLPHPRYPLLSCLVRHQALAPHMQNYLHRSGNPKPYQIQLVWDAIQQKKPSPQVLRTFFILTGWSPIHMGFHTAKEEHKFTSLTSLSSHKPQEILP
jgi:hypothetical protein